MALANTLEVLINAKDNTAQEFDKFETNLKRVADGFTAAGKKMVLSGVAMAGAVGLSVREFMKEDQIVTKLSHVLKTSVNATDEQIESLKEQARELQRVGVISDMATMTFQAQMATFDLNTDTIKAMTPAILDMAVAEKGANVTAGDMIEYANAFGMAMEGNYASLTRRGFKIDEDTKKIIANGTESEKAAAIVAYLDTVYKGLNEEMRKTPAGQLAALKNEFSDLQQLVGGAVAPILTEAMRVLSVYIQRLSEWFQGLSPQLQQLIEISPILLILAGGLSMMIGKGIMLISTIMQMRMWWVAMGAAGQASMLGLLQATAAVGLSIIGLILVLEMAISLYQTLQALRGAKQAIKGGAEADKIRRAYEAGEISRDEAMVMMKGAQKGISSSVRLASGRTGTEQFQSSELGRFFNVFANVSVKKEDEIGEVVNKALKPTLTGE